MTYFKNVKSGRFYRVNYRHHKALYMSKCGNWIRSVKYRNADLSGYPFIAVKEHELLKHIEPF